MINSLVLASSSPRRKQILAQIGLTFNIFKPTILEERYPEETVDAHIKRLSKEKALEAQRNHPDALIIGADTIVEHHGNVLGKPKNAKAAIDMLSLISNEDVCVKTALCLIHKDNIFSSITSAIVSMAALSNKDIAWYVETMEPLDKAGAFAIQGKGARFIKKIDGDYYTVVGLPIYTLCTALKMFNYTI